MKKNSLLINILISIMKVFGYMGTIFALIFVWPFILAIFLVANYISDIKDIIAVYIGSIFVELGWLLFWLVFLVSRGII